MRMGLLGVVAGVWCLCACGGGSVQALTPADDGSGSATAPAASQLDDLWASDYSAHLDLLALGYADGTFEVRYPAPEHVLSRGKHASTVVNLALSPDGQQLATADRSGVVALSEVQSGDLKLLPEAPGAAVGMRTPVGLAWDKSGKQLAISSGEAVRVVEPASGAVAEANLHSPANAVAFSPDGTELAVAGARLTFLSLPGLKEKRRLALPRKEDPGYSPPEALDVRFSADGHWLGVLLASGVAFVQLQTGEEQKLLSSELEPRGIRFASDGRVAVFGRGALYVGPVNASDIQAGARKTGGKLWDVEFRQDGSLLFLGSGLDADLEANL